MNVLLHYNAGPSLERLLAEESTGGLTVTWTPEGDDVALATALRATEVLLHVLEPVSAATMDLAPELRLIQKLGVGVNTIDLDAAAARQISVANMPGANATAVSELTLGLLLAVLRRIPSFDREVRAGTGWPLPADVPGRLGEVAGKTVGLIGYGAIAQRFGAMVAAMGARVIHHRRDRSDRAAVSLEHLLVDADIVSVHLPLTVETANLLDADRLATMRPGAILLNTGRGGVVDEAALARMLASGHLAGAGIDVFATEPVATTSPLLELDNVVVTPHVAWLTADTLERCVRRGVANARRVASGAPIVDRVL